MRNCLCFDEVTLGRLWKIFLQPGMTNADQEFPAISESLKISSLSLWKMVMFHASFLNGEKREDGFIESPRKQ